MYVYFAGSLINDILYSELSVGPHSYTIVTSDVYGFTSSNQLSFTTESKRKNYVFFSTQI